MRPSPVRAGPLRPVPVLALAAAAVALGGAASGPAGAQAVDPAAPPQISHLTFTPSVLRIGRRGAFRFLTSREGAGDIVLERLGDRRRAKAGRLRFAVDAGEGKKSFDGTVAGRRLAPGRYRATLRVINADVGASGRLRVTFRLR